MLFRYRSTLMHSLGLLWAKKERKFTHHVNDFFGKKLSTMVFIQLKSESAHRVILRKNVDLCMKMTLKSIIHKPASQAIDKMAHISFIASHNI